MTTTPGASTPSARTAPLADVRTCLRDGEPLVFTFEFPGAEYFCVVCGGHEDIFGNRAPSTPELQRRLDELTEQYEGVRAERHGRPYQPKRQVGDRGVEAPRCAGCGAQPPEGIALDGSGKPASWYARSGAASLSTRARGRASPDSEAVLPW